MIFDDGKKKRERGEHVFLGRERRRVGVVSNRKKKAFDAVLSGERAGKKRGRKKGGGNPVAERAAAEKKRGEDVAAVFEEEKKGDGVLHEREVYQKAPGSRQKGEKRLLEWEKGGG